MDNKPKSIKEVFDSIKSDWTDSEEEWLREFIKKEGRCRSGSEPGAFFYSCDMIKALRAGKKVENDLEKSREEFENWAHDKGFCLDQEWTPIVGIDGVPQNPYMNEDTKLAFEIWCESRKSLFS